MKKALQILGLAVAVVSLTIGAPAFAQPSGQQAPETKAPAPAPLPISGELVDVDATAKTLVVKKADGTDMKFSYGDDTEIVGADRGLSGLATMSGSEVTVHYTMHGSANVATKIEVRARK